MVVQLDGMVTWPFASGGRVHVVAGCAVGVIVGEAVGMNVGLVVGFVGPGVGWSHAAIVSTVTPQLLHDAVGGNWMEVKRSSPAKTLRPRDTVLEHPAMKVNEARLAEFVNAYSPIDAVVSGSSKVCRPDCLKTYLSMVASVLPVSKVNVLRVVRKLNACCVINVTDLGSSKVVRPDCPKTPLPMVASVLPGAKVNVLREMLEEKAYSSSNVTVLGRSKVVRSVYEKALTPMVASVLPVAKVNVARLPMSVPHW